MRTLFIGFFVVFSLGLKGQDSFFQWKMNHSDRWISLNDSIGKAFPTPIISSQDPIFSEGWTKEGLVKKTRERDLTVRFLVLSKALNDFILDSIQILEQKRIILLNDSMPERHKIAVQGIEKMQQGVRDMAKTLWPLLIEKELAVLEWECHEMLKQRESMIGISSALRDSIWMVGMIQNAQEALLLKNQLLPWNGVNVRSKQVFSLKILETSPNLKSVSSYFWGCDSVMATLSPEKWKQVWKENRWSDFEQENNREIAYFEGLQKNRETWEYLDRRENTLERMRAFVVHYDEVFKEEDSIRGAALLRARSAQELLELRRERERWKMDYYQKGMKQLAEIGQGMEGGPKVQDYSKQKGYFKLKDVQNVKKQMKNPEILENNPEEKETIIPNKPFEMLQIPQWSGLPYSFKTLK